MSKPRIGYVGVGLMGLPMLKRLVSLGYAVTAPLLLELILIYLLQLLGSVV